MVLEADVRPWLLSGLMYMTVCMGGKETSLIMADTVENSDDSTITSTAGTSQDVLI